MDRQHVSLKGRGKLIAELNADSRRQVGQHKTTFVSTTTVIAHCVGEKRDSLQITYKYLSIMVAYIHSMDNTYRPECLCFACSQVANDAVTLSPTGGNICDWAQSDKF